MNISSFKRQKGVFAIEFALGFFVLFMFTMLIFETCRVTYIAAVLDYATAEAARDARVQLQKENKDYEDTKCEDIKDDDKKKRCIELERLSKDKNVSLQSMWYYAYISENAGVLWQIFTSASDYELTVKPYLGPTEYAKSTPMVIGSGTTKDSIWNKATLVEYEVTYTYRPLMFRWSFAESKITRKLLAIQDTALFRDKLGVNS